MSTTSSTNRILCLQDSLEERLRYNVRLRLLSSSYYEIETDLFLPGFIIPSFTTR
jgi:hypothetical protein